MKKKEWEMRMKEVSVPERREPKPQMEMWSSGERREEKSESELSSVKVGGDDDMAEREIRWRWWVLRRERKGGEVRKRVARWSDARGASGGMDNWCCKVIVSELTLVSCYLVLITMFFSYFFYFSFWIENVNTFKGFNYEPKTFVKTKLCS